MAITSFPTRPCGPSALRVTSAERVTTAFGAQTRAADVLDGLDLVGRRAVVTGAASGIGVETARALAGAGADVTLAVRDLEVGMRVAGDITASTGNYSLHVAPLDLADLASVRAFVAAWDVPLDILVNNAGVMATPELRTARGWELQMATNHLGHFALTTGLHRALAAAMDGARVVSVSSSAHLRSGVDLDDLFFQRRAYDPWLAYGQSKSANVLFAVEASRRWADDGITANALTPGPTPAVKTPEQGAATSVLLAASPLLDGVSGRYFEDCNEAIRHAGGEQLPGTRTGVAAHALDPQVAAQLWDASTLLVG